MYLCLFSLHMFVYMALQFVLVLNDCPMLLNSCRFCCFFVLYIRITYFVILIGDICKIIDLHWPYIQSCISDICPFVNLVGLAWSSTLAKFFNWGKMGVLDRLEANQNDIHLLRTRSNWDKMWLPYNFKFGSPYVSCRRQT